jgi:hypothetical protein
MSLIPGLRRLRQNVVKFKAILGYIMRHCQREREREREREEKSLNN